MADTDQVPDDGVTAGSRTTPSTVVAVRQSGCRSKGGPHGPGLRALERPRDAVEARDGKICRKGSQEVIPYAELAGAETDQAFEALVPEDVRVTPVKEWKVLGRTLPRPNARTSSPEPIASLRISNGPACLYGKVLRPPSYGATLASLDPSAAQALPGSPSYKRPVSWDAWLRRLFRRDRAPSSSPSQPPGDHSAAFSPDLFDHLKTVCDRGEGLRSRRGP